MFHTSDKSFPFKQKNPCNLGKILINSWLMDNNSKQTIQIIPILAQSESIYHCGPEYRCGLKKVISVFVCLEIILADK